MGEILVRVIRLIQGTLRTVCMYCDLRRLQTPGVERVPDSRQLVPQIIHGRKPTLSPEVLVLGFDGSAK